MPKNGNKLRNNLFNTIKCVDFVKNITFECHTMILPLKVLNVKRDFKNNFSKFIHHQSNIN